MIFLALFVIDAVAMSIAHFYGKSIMQKGINPKTYVFSINLGLFLCSIPLVIFMFEFTFSWIAVLILLLSVLVRGLNLYFFAKGLNTLSPMEITSIISLSAVFTYFYDVFMGKLTFSVLSLIFLLIIVLGCFVLSKGKIGFKEAKFSILITIITQVGRGILASFALQHMNSTTYLFLMAGITFIALLPFIKIFKPTKFSVVEGFKLQILGTVGFLIEMILAKESVTLFMLASPAIMISTIFLTLIFKKGIGNIPQKRQILGSIIIVTGMILYVITKS